MEVDNYHEDEDSGEEVGEVGEVGSVEGLLQGPHLIVSTDQQVDGGDDGSLVLHSAPVVDGVGGEGFPDNGFADVGGDEQRDG